ncbi:MAG: hypothetical protein FWG90_03585 [Oscillospiraceae bacterium]|nr:hypothetical protein [Oscillospiraceae bacterium]
MIDFEKIPDMQIEVNLDRIITDCVAKIKTLQAENLILKNRVKELEAKNAKAKR